MKFFSILVIIFFLFDVHCSNAQALKRIVLNEKDMHSGHYLVVEPKKNGSISGVLFLLAGFGQIPEDSPPETKLHIEAYKNNMLTIFYAGGNKLYADSITQMNISNVIRDVLDKYNINSNHFIFGGFSAGGMIALRYVELCNEFPDQYPVHPKGVFTIDSPIDIFTIYDQLEETLRNKYSEFAVEEAARAVEHIKNDYGVPRENILTYSKLTPFCMDKSISQNEIFLKNIAVRTYHDVDIAWRIKNRNQTVHGSNYEVSSELINRLVLMGNNKAEFMQSFKTGYRSNGLRHPHSWSIVNEKELIQWSVHLLKE